MQYATGLLSPFAGVAGYNLYAESRPMTQLYLPPQYSVAGVKYLRNRVRLRKHKAGSVVVSTM
jgi:hypothetical protein